MACLVQNIVITLAIFTLTPQVQSANIEIIPNGFIEAVTDSIAISCTPDGTGARANNILVMEIAKDGNTPIVNIQPTDKINYGSPDSKRFEALGVINNTDIPSSYLNLTIKYPTKDDAGTYTCVMSYIDEDGLVKQDEDRRDLTLNTSDTSTIEGKIENLGAALDNLLQRIKDIEKENIQLQAENLNQSQQIQYLREKTDKNVAFSASVSQERMVYTGDTIVFDEVLMNEGQGYNETTGIFTAPMPGLYSFNLVLEIGQGGAVGETFLNVADRDMVKMYTQDKDFGDQGSISAISRLRKGDRVKAEIFLATGNTPRIYAERLCVLSGFLIRS